MHRSNLVQVHDLGLDGDVITCAWTSSMARSGEPDPCLNYLGSGRRVSHVAADCGRDRGGARLCAPLRDDATSAAGAWCIVTSARRTSLLSRSGEVKLAIGIAQATHLTEITRGNVPKAHAVARAGGKSLPDRASDQFAGRNADGAVLGRRPYDAGIG